MPLRVKICGMKDTRNIAHVAELKPDYMGFIFYRESPRYAGGLVREALRSIPSGIVKTGVFVNETVNSILSTAEYYSLTAVQLHGNESPADCLLFRQHGLQVIKALSIAGEKDFAVAANYNNSCDYLLFDTKTPLYGGSGQQYDWNILKNYKGELPFFLSGGISPGDAERILEFSHPLMYGIDLNSRFEKAPGIKNMDALKSFLTTMRTKQ